MTRSRRFLLRSFLLTSAGSFAILCVLGNMADAAATWYGYQSAVSGDTYLVGQRYGSPTPGVGGVSVFQRESSTSWPKNFSLENSLPSGSLSASAEFGGGAVLIDGNTAVVGAYRNTVDGKSQAGNAFVFSYIDSVWINQAVLQMPGGAVGNALFGASGDIDANRVVLTAAGLGKAFVYTGSGETWDSGVELLGGTITNPLGVAIDGNVVAIGNYGFNDGDTIIAPHVDLWRYNSSTSTWNFETSLANPGGSDNMLAASLDLDGNTLVVSARQETIGETSGVGAVYVYEYAGGEWSLAQTIENPLPAANDRFGNDVAIEGNRLAIGAPLDDANDNDAGIAYLYTKYGSTWTQSEDTYSSASPQEGMWFGEAVDISDDVLLVSGSARSAADLYNGEARWFDLPAVPTPPDFLGDANRDGKVNEEDAKALAEHWLMDSGAVWADGDFNYDGKVNDLDAVIMAANWLKTQTLTSSVPEPGITVLLAALATASFLSLAKRPLAS